MDTARAEEGEKRIAADQWDIDGWLILATEAEKAPFEDAKPIYERLVTQFPPSGKFWKSYAEHLAKEEPKAQEQILEIYDKAVKAAPTSIELWRSYLSFATNLAATVPGSKLETDALNVHERAVSAAGLDLNAHPLWSHYIEFVKKFSILSDTQRRDSMRRVYQRAVIYDLPIPFSRAFIPFAQEYLRALETPVPFLCYTSMKKEQIPMGTLCFRSSACIRMNLAICLFLPLDDFREFSRGIPHRLNKIYVLETIRPGAGSSNVRSPIQNLDTFWRDYQTFEQTVNNNKEFGRALIAEYQPKNLEARVEFRARRMRREGLTLSAFPIPPRGRAKESSQAQQWRVFISHERTNPYSLAEADLKDRIVHAYESALGPMYRYPDFWIEYLSYIHGTFSNAIQQASQKTSDKEASKTGSDNSAVKQMASALEPLLERAVKALPTNIAIHVHASWLYARIDATAKAVSVLDTLCRNSPSPLAYIHLMKVTRKYSGRDAARKVFGRARKDPKSAHPSVYVAAALMEFAVKENKVAKNVFEFGLKNFPKSALIASEYVKWLWGTGDFEYARVVLKKVMPNAEGTADEVRHLWEKWLELEELIGDTTSVDRAEELWRESGTGKSGGVVQDVLRRTRFLNFEGLNEDEVAALNIRSSAGDGTTSTAGSGGGRRDPRTGRRIASSGTGKDGGRSSRQGSDTTSASVVKTASDWLHRMAAAMPAIAAPAPAANFLIELIMKTPDSFEETPVGKGDSTGASKESETITGKKRKGDDALSQSATVGNMTTGGVVNPPQDVFRARQAAKQSRMR